MKLIYIEKLKATKNGLPAINKEDHIPGAPTPEGYSLPVEYNIEGYIIDGFEVGKSLIVERTKRNGVVALGIFQTSEIVKIEKDYFMTQNSVYKYLLA